MNKPHQGKQSQSLTITELRGLTSVPGVCVRTIRQPESHHRQCAGDGQPVHLERFYMYRAIPRWRANLTLGENTSILRFSAPGATLVPVWKVRPHAAAKTARLCTAGLRDCGTNARVVISQQGRILYDSTVPQVRSPFRTWTAPCVAAWMLSYRAGRAEKNVPGGHGICAVLTRPGQVRYKLVSGRSRNYDTPWRVRSLLPVRHPGVLVTLVALWRQYCCRGL